MEGNQKEESHTESMARFVKETGGRIAESSGAIEKQADSIETALEMFRKVKTTGKIFALGWGRSGHMVRAFAMRMMHLGFSVCVMGDATTPAVTADDLVIVVSGEGKTEVVNAEILRAIGEAENIQIIAFTSRPLSVTGRLANLVIMVPSKDEAPGTEKKEDSESPPLRTEFEMNALAYLDAVVQVLKNIYGVTDEEMQKRHA